MTSDPPREGTLIPFIDESGSSCSSSVIEEYQDTSRLIERSDDTDTASLSRLLDDATSREFSLSGLLDDEDCHSNGGHSHSMDAISDSCDIKCDKTNVKESSMDNPLITNDSSSSVKSIESSHKFSHSSAISLNDCELSSSRGCSERHKDSFLRPVTCDVSTLHGFSSFSISSQCPVESENPSINSEIVKIPFINLTVHDDKLGSPENLSHTQTSPHTQSSPVVLESEPQCNNSESDSFSNQSLIRCESNTLPLTHEDKSQCEGDTLPLHQDVRSVSQYIVDVKHDQINSNSSFYGPSLISNTVNILDGRTSAYSNESFPRPLISSTPLSKAISNHSSGSDSVVPHHYISSIRVSSVRGGPADMGGALVARVATFLKSQYKSTFGSPILISWCPVFKMLISDFETSLIQVPVSPHHKVPSGRCSIPSILAPQVQMCLSESMVEDRPKRVLIEGDGGICDSNICFKMAYDWATCILPSSYMAGFSLVFVLTLRDFRGGSLFAHMCKEILPRHILSKEAMNTLWTHLNRIETKVLFLLIGVDEIGEDEELGDLKDLIDGSLFPNATVVVTARTTTHHRVPTKSRVFGSPERVTGSWGVPGSPERVTGLWGAPGDLGSHGWVSSLHRKYRVAGLDGRQTADFMIKYFSGFGRPDKCIEVDSLVSLSEEKYRELNRCQIMCLALCILFEDLGGKLPSKLTDFFMCLIKHMVRKNLQRRGEPMCYGVLPDRYCKLLQDFGKIALEALKSGKTYFTGSELKTKVCHGGDIVSLGILVRLKSMSKLNKKEFYVASHVSLLEFVAAFYLSSLGANFDLLQKELDGLAEAVDLANSSFVKGSWGVMVLRYLVGILGRSSYVVFNIVSQMGVSHRLSFLLLNESGMAQMNVIEVCKHVAGKEHVVIPTNCPELEDWGRLLYSPDCTLEGAEVLLDFDGDYKERHESFFTSLSFNESVKSIKLTCLVSGNFGPDEVTRLVAFVRAVLTKRHLESFELTVTCLAEDTSGSPLSPVIGMICDTLAPNAQSLKKLALIVDLDSDQVTRLCEVLQSTPWITVLHLPHLACGAQGLEALAKLVKKNSLVALNLSGSISTGTPQTLSKVGQGFEALAKLVKKNSQVALNLSGSISTGTPIDEKYPSFLPVASPKDETSSGSDVTDPSWSYVDPKGVSRSVFHSLPRSFFVSLQRRGPHPPKGEGSAPAISLKSTNFPPPKCFSHYHLSGFHEVLNAIRVEASRVCHLNLSKGSFSVEDLVCLGETLLLSKSLSSLRLEGFSKVAELVPVLVGLQDNKSIQLLDLTSSHIVMDDSGFQFTLGCLQKNRSLRFLVLNGWTFELEENKSLSDFLSYLSCTELQHLDLVGCRLMVSVSEGPLANMSKRDDVILALLTHVPHFFNSSIAFLNMDNFQVVLNHVIVLRGPKLIFLLRDLPKLVELSLGSCLSGSEGIDDASTVKIFNLLPSSFPSLRRLNITGWIFAFDSCEKILKACGRPLKRSNLKEIELGGVEVRGKAERGMEVVLLSILISNLLHLSRLSLSGLKLTAIQMSAFGKILKEKMVMQELSIETKGIAYTAMRRLSNAVTDGGKCRIVFSGGPSAVYVIKKCRKRDTGIARWACVSAHDSYVSDDR